MPQVSVPSLCVVTMEQLARLVTAREVPVIPPATSSFVWGVLSPMPTSPVLSMFIRSVPPVLSTRVSAAVRNIPVSRSARKV